MSSLHPTSMSPNRHPPLYLTPASWVALSMASVFILSHFCLRESPGDVMLNSNLLEFPNGTLSVELNSADNGNAGVEVRTLGGIGLTTEGTVNP